MNKLMGFYELKASSLPTIPWEIYTPDVQLDDTKLWTIRSAVNRGNDLNLPRLVGKNALEAKQFADKLYNELCEKGLVIYYPYFVAHKSGTLNVFYDKVIIEAVNKDLWNLVTHQDVDVSINFDSEMRVSSISGNEHFLSDEEINKLMINARKVKHIFRDCLLEGKSILLEWSYASNCSINNDIDNEQYLVFYEARTV